jgi:hypothetical protein
MSFILRRRTTRESTLQTIREFERIEAAPTAISVSPKGSRRGLWSVFARPAFSWSQRWLVFSRIELFFKLYTNFFDARKTDVAENTGV